MTRTEAKKLIVARVMVEELEEQLLVARDLDTFAEDLLKMLDPALRFDPEIANFSGTATAVSRGGN